MKSAEDYLFDILPLCLNWQSKTQLHSVAENILRQTKKKKILTKTKNVFGKVKNNNRYARMCLDADKWMACISVKYEYVGCEWFAWPIAIIGKLK